MRVAPEDLLRARFPRFSPLDLRPTNAHVSLAVVDLLSFFNSTSACLLCARADCELPTIEMEITRWTFPFK